MYGSGRAVRKVDVQSPKKEEKTKKAPVRKTKSKKEDMQEITIDGEKIEFKEGALHKQLKTPKGYTFKKAELEKMKKVENGDSFDFLGKKRKMTPLLKKRVNFALVLMKGSKK